MWELSRKRFDILVCASSIFCLFGKVSEIKEGINNWRKFNFFLAGYFEGLELANYEECIALFLK